MIQQGKSKILFGVLFAFLFGVLFAVAGFASAAELFIYPSFDEIYTEKTFLAEVRVDTQGEVLNTIELNIKVSDEFEVIDFVTGNSAFPIFISGPDIKENNSISLVAINPEGFEGIGIIGSITLRSINTGDGAIDFDGENTLLLHDGKGTGADVVKSGSLFTIVDRPDNLPIILSESHPLEGKWYGGLFIRLNWIVKEGAKYSYVLSRIATEKPDSLPDEPVGDIKLATQEEGVFYFHLRECFENSENGGFDCGDTATFQVLRDKTPPEPFKIDLESSPSVLNGKKFITFTAEDKTSGVSYYESIEGEGRTITRSPYVLKNQEFLGTIFVRAFDRTGNMRESSIEISASESTARSMLYIVIIVGTAGAIAIYLLWMFLRKKRLTDSNV